MISWITLIAIGWVYDIKEEFEFICVTAVRSMPNPI